MKQLFHRGKQYNVKGIEQMCSLPNTLYMAAAHLR